MTTSWNRPISRRTLLTKAASGAVMATPLAWLGPVRIARGAGSARPMPADAFDATVPTAWFELVQRLVKSTPGYSPPVASRAMGCLGIGLYEALLPGMPDHVSLAGKVNALPSIPTTGHNAAYHWPSVANATLAAMIRQLFPTAPGSLQVEADELEARFANGAPAGVLARSIDRGRSVAAAIDAWARTDGGHEGYLHNFPSDYAPPQGTGLWVPTPPGYLPALTPYWGNNRPMALDTSQFCSPGPPPEFSSDEASAFYAEALEVYQSVNGLTAEQRDIALFWSDDPGLTATPPGHSISILTQVVRSQDRSLAFAAEAYARVGVALCDGFIGCWHVKYEYNLIRPITYIRRYIDPAWGDPLPVNTPPFPEYTSGHSVQSAAAAEVMTSIFGTTAFTDHTHDARGMAPRSFGSFADFAAEAAISRLYGGIHYRSAIDRGLQQGRCIGAVAAALPLAR